MVRITLCLLASLVGVMAIHAQEPTLLPVVSMPPATVESSLPLGTAISRPLQPVTPLDQQKPMSGEATPAAGEEAVKRATNALPDTWSRYDLLFWFPKAQPLPPLLTAAAPGFNAGLNAPGSVLLLGNRSIDTPTSAGGRFTVGWSWSDDNNWGWEMTYFFTGTRSAYATFDGRGRNIELARPVINPTTGAEEGNLISTPTTPGRFVASSDNRMTGWEVHAVGNVTRSEDGYLNFLAGYRYFMNNEGVRLVQSIYSSPTFQQDYADQFDGHTRFHGAQVGFESSSNWNRFYIDTSMKVAMGRSFQVVNIGGQTNTYNPQTNTPLFSVPFGYMSTTTNSGRATLSSFAVLPEGQLNIGYRFRDRSRIFIGYNFLYLSDAVRPGDQIDRRFSGFVNNRFGPPILPTYPVLDVKQTDFWVHGITIGLDYKY